jgi:hypothetical protein
MATNVIQGDTRIAGTLAPQGFTPPAGCINNAAIPAGAGVAASKLEHQHQIATVHCNHATSIAADRRQIHKVMGATGTITSFGVVATVITGATTTTTVDLYKNGSSILSAAISLTSSTAIYIELQAAGFTSAAVVAGDILEAVISISGSNLPKGVTTHLNLREDAA